MNTELLRRILDKARDDAPNAAAAMAVEDLMRDVQDIDTLLEQADVDGLADAVQALDDFKELREHARTQPFDVVHNEDDEEGRTVITDTAPAAFEEWLGELERLAQ